MSDDADALARLRRHTPARIGIARAGAGMPTAAHLRFVLDHARARDAVHAPLDAAGLAASMAARGWPVVRVRSAARDRAEYLRRPDLGRRLADDARAALPDAARGCDVAVIAADGLSSTALHANLLPVLDAVLPGLAEAGLTCGPVVLVEQGRVAVGDEVGARLGARVAVMLIGERPGLSAANSLGCYVTWSPRAGTVDAARHCISNIRPGGMEPADAAGAILRLVRDALHWRATGVALNARRDGAARLDHALTALASPQATEEPAC